MARVGSSWGVNRGSHGGYQLALLLRAAIAVEDSDAVPISISAYFLQPVHPGVVSVMVTPERRGSSVSVWLVRLLDNDRPLSVALISFTRRFTSLDAPHASRPDVPLPDTLPLIDRTVHRAPYLDNWELRPCLDGDATSACCVVGGWVRLAAAEPVDSCVIAAMADAWPPAIYAMPHGPVMLPTLNMTVQFRAQPAAQWDYCLARFRSTHAHGGLVEEDGEIWDRHGVLLAQSRQLMFALDPSLDEPLRHSTS
jgi:acyl-CoA thioesterase